MTGSKPTNGTAITEPARTARVVAASPVASRSLFFDEFVKRCSLLGFTVETVFAAGVKAAATADTLAFAVQPVADAAQKTEQNECFHSVSS